MMIPVSLSHFFLSDGVLCRSVAVTNENLSFLQVWFNLLQLILIHNTPQEGHPGRDKSLALVRKFLHNCHVLLMKRQQKHSSLFSLKPSLWLGRHACTVLIDRLNWFQTQINLCLSLKRTMRAIKRYRVKMTQYFFSLTSPISHIIMGPLTLFMQILLTWYVWTPINCRNSGATVAHTTKSVTFHKFSLYVYIPLIVAYFLFVIETIFSCSFPYNYYSPFFS